MTLQILLFLVILLATIVLFSYEWFPADVTALCILLVLVLTGLLPPKDAFAGFGSDVVVMLLGLLILTAALSRTGATDMVGRMLVQLSGANIDRLFPVIMVVAVLMSAFMSNTASTALLLPIVVGLSHRARISPSKLLMPLAFASILASSITLVGTSTNIVVSGLMTQFGMAPMGMFELTLVGVPIAVVGVIYMLTIGRRMIPERAPVSEADEVLRSRVYLTELVILPDSDWAGKTLAEARLGRDLDLKVLQVIRGKNVKRSPGASTRLEANDLLLVEGEREDLLRVEGMTGIQIKAEAIPLEADPQTQTVALTEVILLPGSPMIRRTLAGLQFRERYNLQILALNRHGETLLRKMSETRLRMGDVLLVQGDLDQIAVLEKQNVFHILGTVQTERPARRRSGLATSIFALAVITSAVNLLSLPVAMLLGALLVLMTRCITPEEAYRRIQWNSIILIACMLGLGAAMEVTGTANFLAVKLVALLGQSNPVWLLTAFFFLTVLLTQPMSNQSAAAIVLPVAVQAAIQLGLNPRSFAMMIALAASCSFLTPLEPACLMVHGPGHYRFMDFMKVGLLLTVLIYLISIAMVPLLWPL